VAYNFQTGNNKLKLLTDYVTQNVLLGNAVLAALISEENITSYLKMATVLAKALWVLRFFETKSVIKMQCRYTTQHGKDPPSDNAIRR
jgi:hypothetical protein